MTEVTDVIMARHQLPDPEPFRMMIVWSLAAHLGMLTLLLFGPFDWGIAADDTPRTVMTISLAGAPGPRAGGMTPTGGRAIPEPTPAPPRPAPPPPPKPREDVVPTRPVRRPPPPKPSSEEPPQPGVTRTETGARGQGFGLATGGGRGIRGQLPVCHFCFPEYIEQIVTLIQRNSQPKQGVRGS